MKSNSIENALIKLENEHAYRAFELIIPVDATHLIRNDKKILNFCSSDIFGLSQHADLKKNAMRLLLQYGTAPTSSWASHAVLECQMMVEEKIAQLIGTETALLFSGRFQANAVILASLATPQSMIFIDEACHSSLTQGVLTSKARVRKYIHNDLNHLEQLLETAKNDPCDHKLLITESLFGLEGDICDLENTIELAQKYGALLYVDESHAIGIMGHQGMGLTAQISGVDVVVGCFSKACGASGAYVGCSQLIKEYLLNTCPAWRDGALSPAAIGAVETSLDIITQMEGERKQLKQRALWLCNQLQEIGFNTANSSTHLIPIILETPEETAFLAQSLLDANLLVLQMQRHPRLRLSVNLYHTPEDLAQCSAAFSAAAMHSLTDAPPLR